MKHLNEHNIRYAEIRELYIISKENLQITQTANKKAIHIKTNKIGNCLKASLSNNNLYINLSRNQFHRMLLKKNQIAKGLNKVRNPSYLTDILIKNLF